MVSNADFSDLSCGIFVDANISEDELLNIIQAFINGKRGVGSTKNQYIGIIVDQNDEWDENKKKNIKNGFLFYKFVLDTFQQENTNDKDYMEQLKSLINYLRSQGFKVIPTDYEEELNEEKHYT